MTETRLAYEDPCHWLLSRQSQHNARPLPVLIIGKTDPPVTSSMAGGTDQGPYQHIIQLSYVTC